MRVRDIEFSGYKAYPGGGDQSRLQQFEIAPLTLVFGKNNSGKSAASRLPRLLLGGLECNDGQVLPLAVRGHRFGSTFLDLVHGGDFFGRPTFRILAEHGEQMLDLTATLFSRGALATDEPPRIWAYQMRAPIESSIAGPPDPDGEQTTFGGLLPPGPNWDDWRKAAGTLLDDMVHLGPTRAPVLPAYSTEQSTGLDANGQGAPQLLRSHGLLAEQTGQWYEQHMEGWRLSINKDGDSFRLRIARNTALSTNLAHGGEGLQQVLPIVVHQLWRQHEAPTDFLDIIEQPELHLHAAAQAPLADLFIATALKGRGQLIVETHSEPILLRVQRRVAEGRLSPDLIAIYFVSMTEDGARLRRIALNESGEVDWWPAGVFEEDFREVAAIRRAQRARGDT